MTPANKALVMLVVASLGLYGCAKGPANGGGNVERLRTLEMRVAKAEDDFRAAAKSRDQLRQELTTLKNQKAQYQQQRDQLQQQLISRTNERDTVQVQYEQFRKEIRNLLGQAEAAANPVNPAPVAVSAVLPAPGQS